jgi:transcriptional regulator with PAS, ATPase and Fis domain
VDGIDPQALELLSEYSFSGNVRELENMLEGVALTLPAGRATIRAEDIRAWLHRRGATHRTRGSGASGVPLNLGELERWAIREALRQSRGNKSAAAHALGISRDTLYRKLQDLALDDDLSESLT